MEESQSSSERQGRSEREGIGKKGNGGERRPWLLQLHARAGIFPPPVSAAPLPAPLGRKKFKSFVFSYYIYSTTTSMLDRQPAQVTY